MKKYFGKITIILYLLSIFMFVGCTNKTSNGTYPSAIAWDNISYGLSITEVSKSELGKQLGEIKRMKLPMPIENGDSNNIPVGSGASIIL